LNPSPNPSSGNDGDKLLLLLFPKGGLLLFPSSKALNPLNRFTPIISKCKKCFLSNSSDGDDGSKKYPLLVFPVLIILFYQLLF